MSARLQPRVNHSPKTFCLWCHARPTNGLTLPEQGSFWCNWVCFKAYVAWRAAALKDEVVQVAELQAICGQENRSHV